MKNVQLLKYSVLIFTGIIILLNILSDRFYLRLDATKDNRYTLSNATKDILRDLQGPVTIKAYFSEKWGADIPIIAAGGIWDRKDLLYALEQGADGVQMATRFVCTEECDASDAFKQAYLNCTPEDIVLIMSPAGLPGRVIKGNLDKIRQRDVDMGVRCPTACLKKCSYKKNQEHFCIIHALDRAQQGDVETGLVFCGTNAWKSDRITTVQEIFDELFDLAETAPKNNAVNL